MAGTTGSPLLDLPTEIRKPNLRVRHTGRPALPSALQSRWPRLRLRANEVRDGAHGNHEHGRSAGSNYREMPAGLQRCLHLRGPHTLHELENLKVHGLISFQKHTTGRARAPRTHRYHHINSLLRMDFNTLAIALGCVHYESPLRSHCVVAADWILQCFLSREHVNRIPRCRNFSLSWSDAYACTFRAVKTARLDHIKSNSAWYLDIEESSEGFTIAVNLKYAGSSKTS
jgi:hypothetical protein